MADEHIGPDRMAGLHLGRTPPPVGGVTLHCARVRDALGRVGCPTPVVPGTSYWPVRRLVALVRQARADRLPVWIHFSTLSRAGAVRLAVVIALMAPCAVYLVPHSGTFPSDLLRRGWAHAWLRRALGSVTGAVCFSAAGADVLRGLQPRLDLVRGHSFLPDRTLERERHRIPASSTGTRTVVTSGYPTGTYNYLDTIGAVECLRSQGLNVRLRIFHYGPPSPAYWARVRALARASPGVELVTTRDSGEFFRALHDADLYLRNTRHDSYGVACAEAIYLGTPVMATDVCDRAPGVHVFHPTDLKGLPDVLRWGLDLQAPQNVEVPTGLDAYLSIMERWGRGRTT